MTHEKHMYSFPCIGSRLEGNSLRSYSFNKCLWNNLGRALGSGHGHIEMSKTPCLPSRATAKSNTYLVNVFNNQLASYTCLLARLQWVQKPTSSLGPLSQQAAINNHKCSLLK
jgi:hypothetical protein